MLKRLNDRLLNQQEELIDNRFDNQVIIFKAERIILLLQCEDFLLCSIFSDIKLNNFRV